MRLIACNPFIALVAPDDDPEGERAVEVYPPKGTFWARGNRFNCAMDLIYLDRPYLGGQVHLVRSLDSIGECKGRGFHVRIIGVEPTHLAIYTAKTKTKPASGPHLIEAPPASHWSFNREGATSMMIFQPGFVDAAIAHPVRHTYVPLPSATPSSLDAAAGFVTVFSKPITPA